MGSKQEGKTGSEVVDKEEAGLVFEVAKVDADQVGEVAEGPQSSWPRSTCWL